MVDTTQLKEGSILLQPGPVEPDEVTGDKDLVAVHSLGKIAASVLSPQFRLGNYEAGLPPGPSGRPDWRKGPGMELAPLGNTYPSANPPPFVPLSAATLQAAFTLQPGACQLPEADKGVPVLSALAGAAPVLPPAAVQPPAAGAALVRPSFKFKVKIGPTNH